MNWCKLFSFVIVLRHDSYANQYPGQGAPPGGPYPNQQPGMYPQQQPVRTFCSVFVVLLLQLDSLF